MVSATRQFALDGRRSRAACGRARVLRVRREKGGRGAMRLTTLVLVASLACSSAVPPNVPETWPFRGSRLVATSSSEGIVSTTDPIASEVGAAVIRRGGNAVDAAVAVHFALAVVNPEAGNIGGGGFMMVRLADGTTAALDFREAAPQAATANMFLDPPGNVTEPSLPGPRPAGVRGSVRGMGGAPPASAPVPGRSWCS